MSEILYLKWGTLKGWKNASEATRERLRRYDELGASVSAMAQKDTDEQRAIICEIIDGIDGQIVNDWSGEVLTKAEAKEYVLEYGKPAPVR